MMKHVFKVKKCRNLLKDHNLLSAVLTYCNRPFPTSLYPLCQEEFWPKTICMEMCLVCRFIFKLIAMQTFAQRFVLKQRHKGTQKWPIFYSEACIKRTPY